MPIRSDKYFLQTALFQTNIILGCQTDPAPAGADAPTVLGIKPQAYHTEGE